MSSRNITIIRKSRNKSLKNLRKLWLKTCDNNLVVNDEWVHEANELWRKFLFSMNKTLTHDRWSVDYISGWPGRLRHEYKKKYKKIKHHTRQNSTRLCWHLPRCLQGNTTNTHTKPAQKLEILIVWNITIPHPWGT